MGPIQTIDEFLGLLVRRRLLIAVVLLAGMVGAVMLGLSRPKTYQAAAVIQVELPIVETDGTTPGQRAARLLQVIEQRLTTREALLAMIDRHGLFADVPGLPEAQRLTALRAAMRFEPVASVDPAGFGQPGSVSALIVSATLGNPEQAARLANDLAQSVLDLSAERQSGRARENLTFYLQEEARLGAAITTLEQEITAYKNANAADLGAASASDRTAIDTDLRRVQQELLAVQAEAAALAAKDRLRETDRRRQEDLAAQESVLAQQIAALQDQRAALGAADARAPEIERQLGAYDRQMSQLRNQFDQISARRAQAETDLRLEEERHAEHFTLLERAIVPVDPVSGGGKKIAIAGAMASLLLALGLAYALDLLNPAIRSAAQMQRDLDLRPVIVLPELPIAGRGGWRGWLRDRFGRGDSPAA